MDNLSVSCFSFRLKIVPLRFSLSSVLRVGLKDGGMTTNSAIIPTHKPTCTEKVRLKCYCV